MRLTFSFCIGSCLLHDKFCLNIAQLLLSVKSGLEDFQGTVTSSFGIVWQLGSTMRRFFCDSISRIYSHPLNWLYPQIIGTAGFNRLGDYLLLLPPLKDIFLITAPPGNYVLPQECCRWTTPKRRGLEQHPLLLLTDPQLAGCFCWPWPGLAGHFSGWRGIKRGNEMEPLFQ